MWTNESFKRWWYRMGEIFGTRWFEVNGPEPSNLWQHSLMEMSMEKAGKVIDYFRASGHAHPPTMSEVVQVARSLRMQTATPQLPAPEGEPKQVVAAASVMAYADSMRGKQTRGQRRNIFLHGESYGEYMEALFNSRLPKKEFDAHRLVRNGWTAEDEKKFQHHGHLCRGAVLDDSWLISRLTQLSDPEAIAERRAIQEES